MTDCHFSTYHITGIRILITGRACRTWVARAYAPCGRVTGLLTGAEQPVVWTGEIIRCICTFIVDLVAGIHSTVNAVAAVGRCAVLAGAGSCVTGFRTVAEKSIIAIRIKRALRTRLAFSVS
jgi:hypothetical protein